MLSGVKGLTWDSLEALFGGREIIQISQFSIVFEWCEDAVVTEGLIQQHRKLLAHLLWGVCHFHCPAHGKQQASGVAPGQYGTDFSGVLQSRILVQVGLAWLSLKWPFPVEENMSRVVGPSSVPSQTYPTAMCAEQASALQKCAFQEGLCWGSVSMAMKVTAQVQHRVLSRWVGRKQPRQG